MQRPPRARLFGIQIDRLTMDETVDRVGELIDGGVPTQHCAVNAGKIVLMEDDEELRRIIGSCALVSADGQAVVWASHILGDPLPERVAGIDLFMRLLSLAERQGYSVYFLGARPEVVAEVVRRARLRHPSLRVAGWHDGYFTEADQPELLAEIAGVHPDILLVGMPSPRKEYWLAANLERTRATFAMGVGGSFDILAGVTTRAPYLLQRLGLEWAWRFAAEPRRLWRRYFVGNLRFLSITARQRRRGRL